MYECYTEKSLFRMSAQVNPHYYVSDTPFSETGKKKAYDVDTNSLETQALKHTFHSNHYIGIRKRGLYAFQIAMAMSRSSPPYLTSPVFLG